MEAENRKLRVELDQMKMHHDSEIEAMKKQNNSLLEDGERYKEVCLLNYKHDLFLYTNNMLIIYILLSFYVILCNFHLMLLLI